MAVVDGDDLDVVTLRQFLQGFEGSDLRVRGDLDGDPPERRTDALLEVMARLQRLLGAFHEGIEQEIGPPGSRGPHQAIGVEPGGQVEQDDQASQQPPCPSCRGRHLPFIADSPPPGGKGLARSALLRRRAFFRRATRWCCPTPARSVSKGSRSRRGAPGPGAGPRIHRRSHACRAGPDARDRGSRPGWD